MVVVLGVLGLKYKTMSSPTIEKEENDLGFLENSQQMLLTHSYEAAMDALSSLITRQKRGDRSSVRGKYGKLERMAMYLQVKPFYFGKMREDIFGFNVQSEIAQVSDV